MQANTQDPPIRDKQVWKEIWQMKAPPKVKNFIWRACCNALPTKQALMRRKIIANPICERCKTVVKDTEHALWSCSELDVVWADQDAWSFKYEIEYIGVKELLSWMIGEGESLELFTYTAWNAWNQRETRSE